MTKEDIAKVLKQLRINSGMTQKEAAERLGKKQQTIASWETGQSQPDANTLFIVCEIYGTTVDDAFGFNKKTDTLSPDDFILLKKYHSLDEHGKKMVDFTLTEEFNRCETAKDTIDDDNIVPYPEYPTVTKKDIKSFVARNKKKDLTEKDIADLIYTLFPNGDE